MLDRPELVFGLIGAVGTDLKNVGKLLREQLRSAGYDPFPIRLSDLLLECHRYAHLKNLNGGPEDERIDQLMDAGDDFRRQAGRGDALSLLGISKIRSARRAHEIGPVKTRAYILHSLKHPDEVDTLRHVYGQAFFAVSAYSPRQDRLQSLSLRIAKSRSEYDAHKFEKEANALIEKDEYEFHDDLGQNVRETFPLGDIFFDTRAEARIESQVQRFIDLLFGHPFITPTIDEYGLFHANAAAVRSADLSRQVGAVILAKDGSIVSTGCNDVPKAGGGQVWERLDADGDLDHRDFRIGYDSTYRIKSSLLNEVFDKLQENGWLSAEKSQCSPAKLTEEALYDPDNPILKGARVSSIIEFGRIVHAEMSAITDAARLGRTVNGATLFCTTFPCHMCARHIIASGIDRVVYIEPYPKSMALDLYKNMIFSDGSLPSGKIGVRFEPFVGLSPHRYMHFFGMRKRKDGRGLTVEWKDSDRSPRVRESPSTRDLEAAHINYLYENRIKLGLVDATEAEKEGATNVQS